MNLSEKLFGYLNEFETYIPQYDYKNSKVSNSTVGWQIDHSLKVINGIIGQLNLAPTDKKSKLTLLGRFCLATKYIPRGKGKAPKTVLPPNIIKSSELSKQLEEAKNTLPSLKAISDKATFKHPYFGILTKKQTIKFIEVHTKHHLKIVRDILNVRQN